MSWGAVAGAAIGAVGSMVSASTNKQSAASPVALQQTDWSQEQKNAIQANLANLGQSQQLAAQTNTFNQSEASRLLEAALPGFSKIQAQMAKTAQGLMTNPYELDQDTSEYLSRVAAERGISAGTRGQFNDFSLLKDFGITSMQYGQNRINQAQNLFSTLASTAPAVSPMSPISMFVTPQNLAASKEQYNQLTQGIYQAAANANAAAGNYNNAQMAGALSSGIGGIVGSVDWGSMFGGYKATNTNQGNSTPAAYNAKQQAQAGYNSFWGE